MKNIIEQKSKELAEKHAKIIEDACIRTCEKFKCNSKDLIIEYRGDIEIKICVKSENFKIENIFYCEDGIIKKG